MSVGKPGSEDATATTGTGAVLKPAGAYDEAVVDVFILPPGIPTLIATRDFQRALVLIQCQAPFVSVTVSLDSLGQFPLYFMDAQNSNTLIRYVDYLTICCAELYALSLAGATVTVATVREV